MNNPKVMAFLNEWRRRVQGGVGHSVLGMDRLAQWIDENRSRFTDEEWDFITSYGRMMSRVHQAIGEKELANCSPEEIDELADVYEDAKRFIELGQYGGVAKMPPETRERFEAWLARRDDRRTVEELIRDLGGG